MEFAEWKETLIKTAKIKQQRTAWRFGQSLFNCMDEVKNLIRTTELDCFYMEDYQINAEWWNEIEKVRNKLIEDKD